MRKTLPQGDTYAKSREKEVKSSVSRIYRSSVQLVQRLDILYKSATDWNELFQAETLGIRQKLRSNCEHLMFTNPKDYGRKAEDLLWRKVYYDVIQWLRQRRKGSDGDIQIESAYRTHLLSASGFYFHLLLKLQQHYHIKLESIVSWTAPGPQDSSSDSDKEIKEIKDWALRACQRCLISLGDLARYQQEFEHFNKNMKLAERFYLEAYHLNPALGMPHNQLGTLLGGLAYGCEGVYHYMRCMMSKEKFEGTEGNLMRLFEKNRVVVMSLKELPVNAPFSEKLKRFLVYFIYLQDVLNNHEGSQSCNEEIGQLCQSVLQDMDAVLSQEKSTPSAENGEKQESSSPLTNGEHVNGKATPGEESKSGSVELTGPLMVKLAGALIMTLMKLKAEGSSEASVATAFTLAFLSQLLQQCISSLEQDPANKKTNSANAMLTNGKTNLDQNSIDKEHEQLKKVRQIKKAIKTRRRRQKRREMSSSLDSCSASDSDTIEMDSGDESDLSEGGVEDIESEDEESDDVYVESDSEEESSLTTSSSPRTLFSKQEKKEPTREALNGNSLSEAGKLLTQQIMRDNLMCKNGVVFGKGMQVDASDVSDVETECSVLSWGKREEFEELAVVRRLLNEKLLPAIKVMTDWFTVNPDIISTCVESSSYLWSKMASLLNLLPSSEQLKSTATGKSNLWKEIVGQEMDENWQQTYALPEDVCLYGLDPLMEIHSKMNMYWTRPPKEGRCLETIIRTLSLRNFGFKLSRMKTLKSFSWDESNKQFLGPNQLVEKEKKETELSRHEAANRRSQVMKTMAHRRMQSEVSKLEKSLQSAPKGTTAYLVPDAPALCSQLHLVRRLINMEKFLMIIPIQVIAALDSLKKYDTGARESIKYLEGEFKKGNRWIRAQKDNETVESSKRRGRYDDVAVWRFNQVVNCCRYFVNQTGKGFVTLLTGANATDNPQKGQRKRSAASGTQTTPEVVEFARSCGVSVESLRAFCDKYTSTRSVT